VKTFPSFTAVLTFFSCPTIVFILWRICICTHIWERRDRVCVCIYIYVYICVCVCVCVWTTVATKLYCKWIIFTQIGSSAKCWLDITFVGTPAWRWLGENTWHWTKRFNIHFKQEAVAAPVTSKFSFLSHSSMRPLLVT